MPVTSVNRRLTIRMFEVLGLWERVQRLGIVDASPYDPASKGRAARHPSEPGVDFRRRFQNDRAWPSGGIGATTALAFRREKAEQLRSIASAKPRLRSPVPALGEPGPAAQALSGRRPDLTKPQQPVQMLLSMRLSCCSMARSSGVGPDACGTPGRGTVSPVEVR